MGNGLKGSYIRQGRRGANGQAGPPAPVPPPPVEPPNGSADDQPIAIVTPVGERQETWQRSLAEIRERFPEGVRVSVRRYLPDTRTFESLGSVPKEMLDDDFMLEEFGPGQYELRGKTDTGGMHGAKITVRIGKPASWKPKETPAADFKPSPAAELSKLQPLNAQIELLKTELERRDAMMLRLIDGISSRQAVQATPVSELVGAIIQLQKIQPAAPPVSFSERLMDKMFTMATKDMASKDGEHEDDNSMFGFLRDVWKEFKPIVMQQVQQIPAQIPPPAVATLSTVPPGPAADNPPAPHQPTTTTAAPVPGASMPEEEYEEDVDLTPLFAQIKAYCNAGAPAEVVAQGIYDQALKDENLKAILTDVLANSLEEICTWDPELKADPFAGYFKKLYEVLRVRILGSTPNPAGAGGDARNA